MLNINIEKLKETIQAGVDMMPVDAKMVRALVYNSFERGLKFINIEDYIHHTVDATGLVTQQVDVQGIIHASILHYVREEPVSIVYTLENGLRGDNG